mgnify:FL=1|tara:strand:+ start:253 stop:756 length:504 start_codon:yes stop_codon:yes gene_type:complete
MSKSIIIFSSVDGHTREICDYIAKNLNGEVVVVSLDASPSLIEYDKIIIGASIRYGKYRKNLFEFIKKNQKIIENKENAFFSVNVVARKNEKNTAKSNPYVSKFLKNTSWVPKKIDVFAGKIDYPKYKFLDKYSIKFIMWITKGPTNTSETYEFTDWERVKNFADSI